MFQWRVRHGKQAAARARLARCVAVGAVLAACRGSNQASHQPSAQRYHLTGDVLAVNTEASALWIRHDTIPGFMTAMTMAYPVRDPRVLGTVSPGSRITADVVVRHDSVWLENVVVQGGGQGKQP